MRGSTIQNQNKNNSPKSNTNTGWSKSWCCRPVVVRRIFLKPNSNIEWEEAFAQDMQAALAKLIGEGLPECVPECHWMYLNVSWMFLYVFLNVTECVPDGPILRILMTTWRHPEGNSSDSVREWGKGIKRYNPYRKLNVENGVWTLG